MKYITVKEASLKWNLTERRITMLCRNNRILGARKDGKEWLIPSDASLPLDGRTKEGSRQIQEEVEVEESTISYTPSGAQYRVSEEFEKTYKRKPEGIAFTPYRVNLVGAHSDYGLGKITGFTLDKGIHMAYAAKLNGIVEIFSLQFPKRAQWTVFSIPEEKQGDWADHLRGATLALSKRYPLRTGFCAIIDGELPIGGLSSSAAVIITFLSALGKLNHIHLDPEELIEIAKEAENAYVGVACGRNDQTCEVYSRKDSLLYFDTYHFQKEVIPQNKKMKPYEIAIFFSGLTRSLAGTKLNMRVDELRSAAYALKAFAGMEYGKFIETNIREIPYEIYLQYKEKLPSSWRKRAEHWYTEQIRVERAVQAWREGDIETFGRMSFESGASSIVNWETGSPELQKIYEIMRNTKGIYGGRFSGAGFKGCCVALIDPDYEKEILETVKREYLKEFPELKGKYSAHICHTADGVKLD